MGGFGHTARLFALDLISMILFLVIVLATGNVFLATGVGIAAGLAQLAWQAGRRRAIGMLQWASLGLVVVFGSATLLTHDPRFIMFKPTAINLILGAVMLKPGWMERYVPQAVLEAARPMLRKFGFVWSGLMFLTAALNLVLVFTVDPTTWAKFNLIFPPVSIIGLFLFQNGFMRWRAARAGYAISKTAP